MRTGSQSQYLDRMLKNKIEKLSRLKDEEKNRVKAKRAQLEALKTELEMIRLISGGGAAGVVATDNDEQT